MRNLGQSVASVTTYKVLPISSDTREKISASNMHLKIVYHLIQPNSKRDNIFTSASQWIVVISHQALVEVAQRSHNIDVGLQDHYCYVCPFFVILHNLKMVWCVFVSSRAPFTIAIDCRTCL